MRVSPRPSRQRIAVQPNEQSVSSASERLRALPSPVYLSSIQGGRNYLKCYQTLCAPRQAQAGTRPTGPFCRTLLPGQFGERHSTANMKVRHTWSETVRTAPFWKCPRSHCKLASCRLRLRWVGQTPKTSTQARLEEAIHDATMTSSLAQAVQPPAATGPASCSRSSVQTNSEGPEDRVLRARGIGCSGCSARNSAQLNSDCCCFPWP